MEIQLCTFKILSSLCHRECSNKDSFFRTANAFSCSCFFLIPRGSIHPSSHSSYQASHFMSHLPSLNFLPRNVGDIIPSFMKREHYFLFKRSEEQLKNPITLWNNRPLTDGLKALAHVKARFSNMSKIAE